MKKKSILFFIFLAISLSFFSIVSSINIDLKKNSNNEVMISKVELPTYFNFTITNKGVNDSFRFYTFFGSDFEPMNPIQVSTGESKNVIVAITPRNDFLQLGIVGFDLFVQSLKDESKVTFPITLNFIPLYKVLKVESLPFNPESQGVSIIISNNANFYLKNMKINFKSDFFNKDVALSLNPYESKIISIPLEKNNFKGLSAGKYPLEINVNLKDEKSTIDGTLDFLEKEIITTQQESNGFIINKKIISKTNEGNLITPVTVVVQRNIISRLFSKFNPVPSTIERKGFNVYYTWERGIKPGETFQVESVTNWTIPLLVIFVVIIVFILIKQFSLKDLELRKKVSFVKVKGGEFALKISVFVKANQFVERVNVIDRLPPLVKLHERFGGEVPSKIDEKLGKLEWSFDRLRPGESRVLSYVVYSKVGVVGKFVLPRAAAVYEREGEVKNTESNQEFFIAEQKKVIDSY